MKKKILACVLMFTLVFGGSVFMYANAFVGDDAGYVAITATGSGLPTQGMNGEPPPRPTPPPCPWQPIPMPT